MDDKTTITNLQNKFKASMESAAWKNFIVNAVRDFEFKEGIQWTSDEVSALGKRGQAATVENEIKPIIDRILGQYRQMKTKIIFRGRNIGNDEEHNNIMSALGLHIQQRTNYEFEEADMFEDGQTCGFGCLEVFIDYDDDLSPRINIKHENSLNIFPDPNSTKYNWNDDAEFICRAKWVSYEKALQMYPDFKDEIEGYINCNPVNNASQVMERHNLIDYRLKRIRLVEVWYKTYEKKQFGIHPELGGVKEITGIKKKVLSDIKKQFPDIKIHDKIEVKMRMGIFIGDTVLEDKESPYEHNLFPFVPYFVYRRKNGEPYSITRMLEDPQMEINKRRSKALHLLSTNQVMFEEGAVRDEDDLKIEMAKPDGLLKYRKGFIFAIHKNIDLASSQIQLQGESKASMGRISGISDEAMARHSEIRSGIGLQRKQAMTDIIMSPIFDNLRRTRLMVGNLEISLIRQYYTDEKVFDVTDDMQQVKHFEMNNEVLAKVKESIYDVIIDEAPNTATIQEEQFMYLAELVKGLALPANVSMGLLPVFIRLSALKNKDEVAKIIEQMQQQPPEIPKTSLSLVWSELYPEEKAQFAQMMGLDQLAQFEMQSQNPPKQIISKPNPQIEQDNAQMNMQIKSQEHQANMGMNQDKHQQDMGQLQDKHNLKMQNEVQSMELKKAMMGENNAGNYNQP